jgi:hypothetical protein
MSHNTYTVVQAVLIAVAHAHTALIHVTVATAVSHARTQFAHNCSDSFTAESLHLNSARYARN